MATIMGSLHDPKLLGTNLSDENISLLQSLTTKRLLSDIYTCQIRPPQLKTLIEHVDPYHEGFQPRTVYCSISGGMLEVEYSGSNEDNTLLGDNS